MDTNTILTIVIAVVGLAVGLFALNRSRSSSGASEARPAEAPAMPAPPAPKAPTPAAPRAPQVPQVEAGIPPEVVAVIAAAVCAMGGGKYTLKAVRRADRSAWARAGALDVTEPF